MVYINFVDQQFIPLYRHAPKSHNINTKNQIVEHQSQCPIGYVTFVASSNLLCSSKHGNLGNDEKKRGFSLPAESFEIRLKSRDIRVFKRESVLRVLCPVRRWLEKEIALGFCAAENSIQSWNNRPVRFG